MKAITVRQPWAWLILHAGKDIENRTWPTNERGRVLVHAAKGCTRDEYEYAVDFALEAVADKYRGRGLVIPAWQRIERGGIVGSVESGSLECRRLNEAFRGCYLPMDFEEEEEG